MIKPIEHFVNRIICGDCLEIMKDIPDNSVNLTLTDIPYGVVNRPSGGIRNFNKKDADIFKININRLLDTIIRITSQSIYIFCGTEQISEIRKKMVASGLTTRLIIWEKTNPSPVNGQYLWLSSVECCVFGRKKKATFNLHCESSVVRFPSTKSKKHPTQKPLELFKYLIEASSNENDIVLDPFLGGGTTAVACKMLNRKFIGIELNPEYCEIARKRIKSIPERLDKFVDKGDINGDV